MGPRSLGRGHVQRHQQPRHRKVKPDTLLGRRGKLSSSISPSHQLYYSTSPSIPCNLRLYSPSIQPNAAQQDSWVADHTRDALIDARGHRSPVQTGSQAEHWKPVMLIDKEGMPHDFCTTIRNSNSVADKVKMWVDGIIEAHKKEIS